MDKFITVSRQNHKLCNEPEEFVSPEVIYFIGDIYFRKMEVKDFIRKEYMDAVETVINKLDRVSASESFDKLMAAIYKHEHFIRENIKQEADREEYKKM